MNNRTAYSIIEDNREKRVILPQYFWYGRKPIELTFPGEWNIHIGKMKGDDDPVLNTEQLRQKIFSPIGTVSLKELAKGKKEVAIIVDDISRPTEASFIIPHLLKTLSGAGISEDSIRFLISLGCHGAHTREEFVKKLGEEIVQQFRVYNHNCYENCVEIGHTRSGLPLEINAELMKCDLKIGIGAILPHLYTGYSGGGKLFLPGMAQIDTVHRFHSFLTPSEKGINDVKNPMIGEIEDAVKLIGVDYIIDVLVNTQGQIIDLFAGNPIAVYREGCKKAAAVYETTKNHQFDVVISNAHLKVNEGDIALLAGLEAVDAPKGICVLIMNSPSGQMTHYLMRRFGKYIGGRQSMTRVSLPEDIRIMVYSRYKDTTTFDPYENKENIDWVDHWPTVVEHIYAQYGDRGIQVCIIPDGTIQFWALNPKGIKNNKAND